MRSPGLRGHPFPTDQGETPLRAREGLPGFNWDAAGGARLVVACAEVTEWMKEDYVRFRPDYGAIIEGLDDAAVTFPTVNGALFSVDF